MRHTLEILCVQQMMTGIKLYTRALYMLKSHADYGNHGNHAVQCLQSAMAT